MVDHTNCETNVSSLGGESKRTETVTSTVRGVDPLAPDEFEVGTDSRSPNNSTLAPEKTRDLKYGVATTTLY